MCSTANIVRVGVAFETVGFLLTLYGLNKTWRFGDGAGTIPTVARWARTGGRIVVALAVRPLRWLWHSVRRVLLRHRPPETKVIPIPANVSARADVTTTLTGTAAGEVSGLTVEQRLDALNRQFKALADETAREREAHSQAIAGLHNELGAERSDREAGDTRTHGTLKEFVKDFARSGLRAAVGGVLLFFLAAVLTGLPAGTAHLLCG